MKETATRDAKRKKDSHTYTGGVQQTETSLYDILPGNQNGLYKGVYSVNISNFADHRIRNRAQRARDPEVSLGGETSHSTLLV